MLLAGAAGPDGLSAADSLRAESDRLNRQADSLMQIWDRMWKQSDSLRIESMLVRIKSNNFKQQAAAARSAAARSEKEEADRLAAALAASQAVEASSEFVEGEALIDSTEDGGTEEERLDQMVDDDPIVAAVEQRAMMDRPIAAVRATKVRSGQTQSDSLTALVMRFEPDTGMASYYADAFHGKKTSSGEVYNMHGLTCAHRWLPFGTQLRVTNLKTGMAVVVRVNDRGPFHHGRLIDLSKGAAKQIDMIRSGTTRVSIEVVESSE